MCLMLKWNIITWISNSLTYYVYKEYEYRKEDVTWLTPSPYNVGLSYKLAIYYSTISVFSMINNLTLNKGLTHLKDTLHKTTTIKKINTTLYRFASTRSYWKIVQKLHIKKRLLKYWHFNHILKRTVWLKI